MESRKMVLTNLSAGAEIETQTENRHMYTAEVGLIESIEIYALPYF